MAEEEFQAASSSSKSGAYKRVYIANLPSAHSFPSTQALQEALHKWICEQIPDLFLRSQQSLLVVQIVEGNSTAGGGGGGKRSNGSSLHALVECGPHAATVIRSLHHQVWEGRTLNVQREKRTNPIVNSSSSTNKNHNNHSYNHKNHTAKKPPGFGGKGWSAPRGNQDAKSMIPPTTSFTPIPIDQASRDIKKVVEEELQQQHANAGEDPIHVAIAATAAATFLAAMGAFEEEKDNHEPMVGTTTTTTTAFDGDKDGTIMTTDPILLDHPSDGQASCDDEPIPDDAPFQIKPMSELLADFGEQDPDWHKQLPPMTGDADHVGNSSKDPSFNNNHHHNDHSQLAPRGKAPIHISLTSFSFTKGGPKRAEGWSHRQPLFPLDCREFPTVPQYLAWQDGLSSNVKRVLQYPRPPQQHPQHSHHQRGSSNRTFTKEAKDADASSSDSRQRQQQQEQPQQSIYDFARKTVAPQIFEALLNAQNEGGHGYVSPLEMTIYIGSDLGRHRSVVVCEWAAMQLRKLLRQNPDHAVHQPVSVGTCHRDLEPRRQQQPPQHFSHPKGIMSNHGKNTTNELQGKTLKKKQMEMAGDW